MCGNTMPAHPTHPPTYILKGQDWLPHERAQSLKTIIIINNNNNNNLRGVEMVGAAWDTTPALDREGDMMSKGSKGDKGMMRWATLDGTDGRIACSGSSLPSPSLTSDPDLHDLPLDPRQLREVQHAPPKKLSSSYSRAERFNSKSPKWGRNKIKTNQGKNKNKTEYFYQEGKVFIALLSRTLQYR
jgi:hypothetical protein